MPENWIFEKNVFRKLLKTTDFSILIDKSYGIPFCYEICVFELNSNIILNDKSF